MSDALVRAAIERMEAWLSDPNWEPDPEALTQWDAGFQAALAQAEKATGWPDLTARAHAAGRLLEIRLSAAEEERDRIRVELDRHGRGNRALKGYGSNTR